MWLNLSFELKRKRVTHEIISMSSSLPHTSFHHSISTWRVKYSTLCRWHYFTSCFAVCICCNLCLNIEAHVGQLLTKFRWTLKPESKHEPLDSYNLFSREISLPLVTARANIQTAKLQSWSFTPTIDSCLSQMFIFVSYIPTQEIHLPKY